MKVIDRDRWVLLEPLLDEALELTTEEQATWLEQLRASSPDLAAEVATLLSGEAAADHDRFLIAPPDSPLSKAPLEGLRLGAYELERPIAEGGMGWVWLARRADGQFEGHAAVKLLNLALLGPAGRERFRREGSMLAQLAHPGIARLLDAGVAANGQPYLVLEYVDGVRIDEFCDGQGLTPAARIRLVLQVLSAVAHAHASLIVHRDLKPSNILVAADGMPKLLDFGIAKLLPSESSDERTALTMLGGRPLTPDYASPEQVSGGRITTATDVYALGVLLYTLLSGKRPYDLAGLSAAAIERTICEADPVKPSATFTAADADVVERARARGSTPEKLRRQLHGDLDAIVGKAMHKDSTRRYQSVASFADDLERLLDRRTVVARPDSVGYRARKFMLRHRIGLAAGAAILVLLVTYGVTVIADRARIQRALQEARLGTRKAEQVTDLMLGLFQASEGGKALTDTVTARQLLGRGLEEARELEDQPELQAQMLDVLGRLHMQLGNYDAAQPLLEQALALRRRLYGDSHADVATSLDNVARVMQRRERTAEALKLRQDAYAMRLQLSGPEDAKTIDALYGLAAVLHHAGRHDESKPYFEQWMEQIARQPRQVTATRADQLIFAAQLLAYGGQPQRAEPMMREGVAIRRAVFGDRHHQVAAGLHNLASLLFQMRRAEEADVLLREAIDHLRSTYPAGHPQMAVMLKTHGNNLARLGRLAEAEVAMREALDLNRRFVGEKTLVEAVTALDLAYILIQEERYDEAATLSRTAARTLAVNMGADNLMTHAARAAHGDALRGLGRYREAEALLLDAFAKLDPPRPATLMWRRGVLNALVRLYEAEARPEEAAKYRALRAEAQEPASTAH